MAGEQSSYLRFRIPDALKDEFKAACKARGQDMSKAARNLLEGFRDADINDPLIAPLRITSKKK